MPARGGLVHTIEIRISTGVIGIKSKFLHKITSGIECGYGVLRIACKICHLDGGQLPVAAGKQCLNRCLGTLFTRIDDQANRQTR